MARSEKWLVYLKTGVSGPHDQAGLSDLYRRGALTAATRIKPENSQRWLIISQVPEVWSALREVESKPAGPLVEVPGWINGPGPLSGPSEIAGASSPSPLDTLPPSINPKGDQRTHSAEERPNDRKASAALPKQFEVVKSLLGGQVVKYACPFCNERLKSPLTDANKQDHCANCRNPFTVPGSAALAEEVSRKQELLAEKEQAAAAEAAAAKLQQARKRQAQLALQEQKRLAKAAQEAVKQSPPHGPQATWKSASPLMIAGVILLLACIGGSLALILINRQTGGEMTVNSLVQTTQELMEQGFVADRSYAAEIETVLSEKTLGDIRAKSSIQQCANGAFRLSDMLAILAQQLDKDGSSSVEIKSVLANRSLNNLSSKGAIQQAANGIYRCVDLLGIVVNEADRQAGDTEGVREILADMRLNDISADSAYQQVANGSFRMAEMLELLCRVTDRKGEHAQEVREIMSEMRLDDIRSRTAMQQSANGLYASCQLMAIFAELVDRRGEHGEAIAAEMRQLDLNDITADTAFQQMANGFYRLTNLAGMAARGIDP